MYYNEKMETMPREALRELQGKRLASIVRYTYDHVPFYRERMQAQGVQPGDIRSLDDIALLPFMTKQDLRDHYPTGTFAAPLKDIVRFHASSGTTGKPIVAGYTRNDLDCWSEGVCRCMAAVGATSDDIAQVSFGYGLFTGGLGAHDGAQRLGMAVLPTSAGNTSKQLMLMRDLGTTLLCCTPSYALHLAESLVHHPDPTLRSALRLRLGMFGAEPWTENMRRELQDKLGIRAYDLYGLTEVSGPGVGGECEFQDGTHLWEDMFLPEIIHPDTLEPQPGGELGELVFTTLLKEGMPVIRYRTRDLTRLRYDRCQCGRTMVRMDRILGRSDDMLIIRGVNVFPSQIESVILEIPEFSGQYFVTVDRVDNIDTFQVDVELRPEFYGDAMGKMLKLKDRLLGRMVSVLGIRPDIRIVEHGTIERSQGKAKHVLDKRNFHN